MLSSLRAGNVEALQSGTTDDTQHSIKRDMGARPSETIHDWGVYVRRSLAPDFD